MQPSDIVEVVLSQAEFSTVQEIAREAMRGQDPAPIETVCAATPVLVGDLPRSVRNAANSLRQEACLALCIRASGFDEERIGPTPVALRLPGEQETVDAYGTIHILFASLLGEPFTWNTIQNGYLVNDVLPIEADASRRLSSSSSEAFDLHTEDAFHPWAGDYLGLFCQRTGRPPATTFFADVEVRALDDEVRDILMSPRFLVGANVAQDVGALTERLPILFGSSERPYFRINLNIDPQLSGDPDAARAYAEIAAHLRARTLPITFRTGDYWYIDNFRVAHARGSFAARFDGAGRWLKRLYVTRDIRKSRALRRSAKSYIVELRPEGVIH